MKDLFMIRRHTKTSTGLKYDEIFLNIDYPKTMIKLGSFNINYSKERYCIIYDEWVNLMKIDLMPNPDIDFQATNAEKKEILKIMRQTRQANKVAIHKIFSDSKRTPKGYY